MIGKVGLSPENYWSYTLRENHLLAQAFNHREEQNWLRTRNIEYSNYSTVFTMNGKRIFKSVKKPQDLYKLPSELVVNKSRTAVFDPDAAIAAYNKTEKDRDKWLTKTLI